MTKREWHLKQIRETATAIMDLADILGPGRTGRIMQELNDAVDELDLLTGTTPYHD